MTEIKGLDELTEKFKKLQGIDKQKIALAGAYRLLKGSQERAPVKTGYLRSSGFVEGDQDAAKMIFGAEYAHYQEFDKHPYIRPTVDEDGAEIVKVMWDEVERQMKEVGE